MNALLETLEPAFGTKIGELIPLVNAATNRTWVIVQGRRTISQQNALYAQGRTAAGKIVTNAPGGSSAHNFGLAADIAPMKMDGSDVDWSAPDSLFKQMADIAVSQGLVSGYYFHSIHDADHVEDPDWKVQQGLWKTGKLHVA